MATERSYLYLFAQMATERSYLYLFSQANSITTGELFTIDAADTARADGAAAAGTSANDLATLRTVNVTAAVRTLGHAVRTASQRAGSRPGTARHGGRRRARGHVRAGPAMRCTPMRSVH